jgi:FKBP-type peptidyl-prolyl cis-trans isomerase FkpA
MDPFRFRPVVTGLEDRLTPAVTPEEVFAAVDTARLSHVGLTEMLGRLDEPWDAAARQQFATHFAGLGVLNRAAEQDLTEFLAALNQRIATEPDVAPHLIPVTGGTGYAIAMTIANAAYADALATHFGGAPIPVDPPPASPPPAPFPGGTQAPFPDSSAPFPDANPPTSPPTVPPAVPPAPFPPDVPPVPPPPPTTNAAPAISNITDRGIRSGGDTGAMPFTVSDDQTAAGTLSVIPTSSDTGLVPLSGIALTGTGADRTVNITPAPGRTGSSVITLTVRDAQGLAAADTFTVSVFPPLATPGDIPLDGSGLSDTLPPVDSPEFRTQANGIRIWDVTEGTGAIVEAGDTITIHYRGWLLDGTVFDSSENRGQPSTFPLDGLIEGWKQGIPGMKEGGTRRLYIPAALAYGSAGRPNIPPDSDLVFEIQLIDTQ